MATPPSLVAFLGFSALLVTSCNSSLGSYQCEQDIDCSSDNGTGARCESNRFCSFADPGCGPDGHRYGDSSGELSNECVEKSDQADAGTVAAIDAAPKIDAIPMAVCTAEAVTFNTVGIDTYSLPENCTSVTIEAFGAGGGGAERGSLVDSGSGGGAGSGAQISTSSSSLVLIAAAGGGGASSDDEGGAGDMLGGGGGGGGHAIATFALSPGTEITVVVGQGGKNNGDTANAVGANGGEPGAGAGGTLGQNGQDASLPWGGGGGGGDDAVGGSSIFGGGGGSDENGNGGGSEYGGAGAGGVFGTGACGQTAFGGPCSGVAGGGGGFFIHSSGENQSGSIGTAGKSELAGPAAMNGPGDGGGGGISAQNGVQGRVVVTPGN